MHWRTSASVQLLGAVQQQEDHFEKTPRTFGQVAAVMVGLDDAFGIVCVDVEGIQVGADALDGRKVLSQGGTGL